MLWLVAAGISAMEKLKFLVLMNNHKAVIFNH
jgi:hypothetical protein